MVADNALDGAGRRLDYTHLPRRTFTSPAIAGLTDAQVNQQGIARECRVLPPDYVPRAVVNRDTRGLVKIVAEQGTGRCERDPDGAGDAIQAGVYAVSEPHDNHRDGETWAPYRTMIEALKTGRPNLSPETSPNSRAAHR